MSEQQRKRRAVMRRDGNRCRYCGSVENLTIDHRIPRSCGGPSAIANLQLLCWDCNQSKADTGAGKETVLRWRGLVAA